MSDNRWLESALLLFFYDMVTNLETYLFKYFVDVSVLNKNLITLRFRHVPFLMTWQRHHEFQLFIILSFFQMIWYQLYLGTLVSSDCHRSSCYWYDWKIWQFIELKSRTLFRNDRITDILCFDSIAPTFKSSVRCLSHTNKKKTRRATKEDLVSFLVLVFFLITYYLFYWWQ